MNNHTAALSYDNMNEACALYVCSPAGRYKPASDEQVLVAGRTVAESLISISSPVNQPTKVKQFFRAKLARLGYECAAPLPLSGFAFQADSLYRARGGHTEPSQRLSARDRENARCA